MNTLLPYSHPTPSHETLVEETYMGEVRGIKTLIKRMKSSYTPKEQTTMPMNIDSIVGNVSPSVSNLACKSEAKGSIGRRRSAT